MNKNHNLSLLINIVVLFVVSFFVSVSVAFADLVPANSNETSAHLLVSANENSSPSVEVVSASSNETVVSPLISASSNTSDTSSLTSDNGNTTGSSTLVPANENSSPSSEIAPASSSGTNVPSMVSANENSNGVGMSLTSANENSNGVGMSIPSANENSNGTGMSLTSANENSNGTGMSISSANENSSGGQTPTLTVYQANADVSSGGGSGNSGGTTNPVVPPTIGGGNGPIYGSMSAGGAYGGSVYYGVTVNQPKTGQTVTTYGIDPNAYKSSCNYLSSYMRIGLVNSPSEVRKLQEFLKNREGEIGLDVSGNFDIATEDAVKRFQERYRTDVLKPWSIFAQPTGIVYITTRKKINDLYCAGDINYKVAPVEIKSGADLEIEKTIEEKLETENVIGQETETQNENIVLENENRSNLAAAISSIGDSIRGFFRRIFGIGR